MQATFRLLKYPISLTEQPFKISYYAALLALLHVNNDDTGSTPQGSSLGRQVLDDLWKAFQTYLDKLAWREIRLYVSHINGARFSLIHLHCFCLQDSFLRTPDNGRHRFAPVDVRSSEGFHRCPRRVRSFSFSRKEGSFMRRGRVNDGKC